MPSQLVSLVALEHGIQRPERVSRLASGMFVYKAGVLGPLLRAGDLLRGAFALRYYTMGRDRHVVC